MNILSLATAEEENVVFKIANSASEASLTSRARLNSKEAGTCVYQYVTTIAAIVDRDSSFAA